MVKENITERLKCCPFCGGKAELRVAEHPLATGEFMVRVYCTKCHCVSRAYDTGKTMGFRNIPSKYVTLEEAEEKAMETWNERSAASGDKRQVKEKESNMSNLEELYNNMHILVDEYKDTDETKAARVAVENALGGKDYMKYEDKILHLAGSSEKQGFINGFQYAVSLLTSGKAVVYE